MKQQSDPFAGAAITFALMLIGVVFYNAVMPKEVTIQKDDWNCTLHHDVVTNGVILGRALDVKLVTVQVCDQWSRK